MTEEKENMPQSMIHPTAIIDPQAEIGPGVKIGRGRHRNYGSCHH